MKNKKICYCCGQPRPFPTEPGEWELTQNITWGGKNVEWHRVTVKLPLPNDRDGQTGLTLWENGKQVWWPPNCAWRKVK